MTMIMVEWVLLRFLEQLEVHGALVRVRRYERVLPSRIFREIDRIGLT